MGFFGQYKVFIVVIGIGILIAGAFLILSRTDSSSAAVSLSNSTQAQIMQSEKIEQELIAELSKLRSIQLNDSFFDTPAFESLIDFSEPIEDQPVGRDNPFLPTSAGEVRDRINNRPGANLEEDLESFGFE